MQVTRFGAMPLSQLTPGTKVRDNRTQEQFTVRDVFETMTYPVNVSINGKHKYVAPNGIIQELDRVK